jgi:hypothetical protein
MLDETAGSSVPSFQWKAVILDDDTGESSVAGLCRQLCPYCGSALRKYDETNLANELGQANTPCDIALVDMNWVMKLEDPGCDASEISLPTPEECDDVFLRNIFGRDETGDLGPGPYLAARVGVIERWLFALQAAICLPEDDEGCRWLKGPLGYDNVGLWLGPMLSWLEPDAEVAFYSGAAQRMVRSPSVAPWLRWRDLEFSVLPKNSEGTDWDGLLPVFRRAQAKYLRQWPVRLWAQQVWLHLWLIGEEGLPVLPDGLFRTMRDGRAQEYSVLPYKFFPQLRVVSDRTKLLEDLRQLVFARTFRVDQCTVQRANHALRHVKSDPASGYWRRSAAEAMASLGLLGDVSHLSHLSHEREEQLIDYAQALYSLRNAVPCMRIYTGCGSAEDEHFGYDRIFEDAWLPTDTLFPVRLHEWKSVVDALRSNAEGDFSIAESADHVCVSFLGAGGFCSIGAFCEAVKQSLVKHQQDGENAGLLFVLLFALQHGADSIEVLIKSEWHDLLSENQPHDHSGAESFGLRFSMPRRGI